MDGIYRRTDRTMFSLLFIAIAQFVTSNSQAAPLTENLASNKPTMQSGTFAQAGFPTGNSHLAVDGNLNGNYFEGSCAHNVDDENIWWVVDLKNVYTITSVVIYNRNDVQSDLEGMKIDVYMNNPVICTSPTYTQCYALIGSQYTLDIISFDCQFATRGRYVRFSRNSYWSFCEVLIYGDLWPVYDTLPCPSLTPIKKENYVYGDDVQLSAETVGNVLECVQLCRKSIRCDAFNYNTATGNCIFFRHIFDIVPFAGWDFYALC